MPEEHPILLTDTALTPKKDREKMTEIMFEHFNIAWLYIATQELLSMSRSYKGRTGVVINCGYDITNIVPFNDGKIIKDAVSQLNIGGQNITEYLAKILTERGYAFSGYNWNAGGIVDDIKHGLGYIAVDYQQELDKDFKKDGIEKGYQLPDGQVITIDLERFKDRKSVV